LNLARAIVDQDEIVSRAVHLGEAQHLLSSSIVCGESQGAAKSPFIFYLPLPVCVLGLIYSAVKRPPISLFFLILGLATQASFAGDYNNLILEQIKQMPQGGR